MTAPTVSKAAQDYLGAVELELADLPADERAELLEDLALHLSELADEKDERTLESRLGSSRDYASELRAAAGLPARSTAPRTRARRLRRLLALTRRTVWDSPSARATRSFLPTLAPAWWVLRGYLVVLLPSLWHISTARDFPVPAPYDSRPLGVGLVLAAVLASIALGRRRLPSVLAVGVVLANVALAGAALHLASTAPHRLATHQLLQVARPDPSLRLSPLVTAKGPVTNIYAYAADGTPLTGVLLYDQDGRPLYTGRQLWFPDHCKRVITAPLAKDGIPIPQSYPKVYVLDPAGLALSGGPVAPGQCSATVAVPKVSLPAPAAAK